MHELISAFQKKRKKREEAQAGNESLNIFPKSLHIRKKPSPKATSENSHILIIQALAVTLTLKTVNQFVCMIIHHNTMFGKKWLSGSGDNEWTPSDTQRKYHPDKHSLTF